MEPEAYGFLMDTMESYMKKLIEKCVNKARIRMQESHTNMAQALVGDQVIFHGVSYHQQPDKKDL